MTWEQYWYGDVWAVEYYQKAEKLRMKTFNSQAHLIGLYVYEAICDASPLMNAFAKEGTKATPYRTKPYDIFNKEKSEEKTEKQEENEALLADAYMRQMVRAGKNWGKKVV